jgi:integrase
LRKARWKEFDLETRKDWSFLISKIKPGEKARPLTVPLPRQAVEILQELHPLTGESEFVFPGYLDNKRPMSGAATNAAIRRMGYDTKTEITGHGFRHIAATLLNERGFDPRWIEEAMGHKTSEIVKGGQRVTYTHAKYIEERRPMMQAWADYLDKLKAGADVIPLHTAA